MKRIPIHLLLLAGLLGLAGTGCKTYKDQSGAIRSDWVQGRVTQAAGALTKAADKKTGGKDGVVWNLEAGAVLRAAGDFTNSNRHLTVAAEQIEEYERKAKTRVTTEAAAMMSNLQNLPYEGRPYDKIMLHTYRALNYLALGELDKARPEIIRAYQRQQDAVAENARRIERAKEEAAASKNPGAVERSQNSAQLQRTVADVNRNLAGFQVYADYVVPFTVYLDALYFLNADVDGSDRERAVKSLQRLREIAGSNSVVQADLGLASTAKVPEGVTYVILETGQVASFNQVRIDIPILVATVSYVGVAFPVLETHGDFLNGLNVIAGPTSARTETIASMDSVVALDFKNEWPAILTRTIISAVAKAAAAAAANNAAQQADDLAGAFMRIGTAIAQAALNIADTRSWTALPKEFQVARVPTPPDRKIVLEAGGRRQEVPLVEGSVNVIYVRSVTSAGPLLINQFKLR
jgi:hypothetical protein